MTPPPATRRLLLVDDDGALGAPLAAFFRRHGIELQQATRPSDALALLRTGGAGRFDAALLDVMLPEMDGFELCRTIRKDSALPIIMLTARGDVMDRVVGLELGADDYLPKTFSSRELLARLRAVLRRTGWIAESAPQAPIKELVIGELRINPETHDVVLGDQPVQLTPAEFGLLLSLAKAHGRVKTREQLIEEVADREWDVFDRAIDMHISTLRKKLGDDPKEPRFIKTVRGYGYQLVTPGR